MLSSDFQAARNKVLNNIPLDEKDCFYLLADLQMGNILDDAFVDMALEEISKVLRKGTSQTKIDKGDEHLANDTPKIEIYPNDPTWWLAEVKRVINNYKLRQLFLYYQKNINTIGNNWENYVTELRAALAFRKQRIEPRPVESKRTSPSDKLESVAEDKQKQAQAKKTFPRDKLYDDVAVYKEKQAKRKVLELIYNDKFQSLIDDIRYRWGIETLSPSGLEQLSSSTPDEILDRCLPPLIGYRKRHTVSEMELELLEAEGLTDFIEGHKLFESLTPPDNESILYELQNFLKNKIIVKEFNLSDVDYGLIVVAIVFGITLENISNHWKLMWRVAQQAIPNTTEIVKTIDDSEKIASLALTLAYIVDKTLLSGVLSWNIIMPEPSEPLSWNNLPKPIEEWVLFSLTLLYELEITPVGVPSLIDGMKAFPHSPSTRQPELFLRVTNETTLADIERAWQLIELEKITIWGQEKPTRTRTTRKTLRNEILYTLWVEHGDYKEVAKLYNKLFPDDLLNEWDYDDVVNQESIDIVRKAIKSVKKSKKETK